MYCITVEGGAPLPVSIQCPVVALHSLQQRSVIQCYIIICGLTRQYYQTAGLLAENHRKT